MSSSEGSNSDFDAVLAEFLTRRDQGEDVDREEFLRRYPEQSDQLREFFANFDFVDCKLELDKATARRNGSSRSSAGTDLPNFTRQPSGTGDVVLPEMPGFRVLEELGSGSQGVVYKAEQSGTKRFVALKVIREGTFASTRDRQRFRAEIELASRLHHPNVVTVYSCGQRAGHEYYAMQYVEGEPLDVYLSARALDIPVILDLFVQVCAGVHYAHQRGVIHRDLKPSNVIVDSSGAPRILDFGLARAIEEDAEAAMTRVGDFTGTWYYASPEQVRRDRSAVDVRTDVYALGVMLFEMLTDCFPYAISQESRDSIARHILDTPPARPSTVRRECDDDLDTIVLKALHKESERRYQTAAALAEDVRRYQSGDAIEAKRDSSRYVLRKMIQRHRWRFLSGALLLIGLLAFSTTTFVLYRRAEAARATTEARSLIVRGSQTYLNNKLDELHRTSNRLNEIVHAHPELHEVKAMARPIADDLRVLFADLVQTAPDGILETMRSRDPERKAEAIAWLDEHAAKITALVETCRTHQLRFGIVEDSESGLAAGWKPTPLPQVLVACEIFGAKAVNEFRRGNYNTTIACLDAARSIAVALGDGRLISQKSRAISIRSGIFNTLLLILKEGSETGADVSLYCKWALSEPPLSRYRLAMISSRQKLVQLYEAATFAGQDGESAFIDLLTIYHMIGSAKGGRFDFADAESAAERQIAFDDISRIIDRYFREVEQWDDLPFTELHNRAARTSKWLQSESAWVAVKPVWPRYVDGFRNRGRVNSMRSATILSALLCQYHAHHGRWPETLLAAADERIVNVNDPHMNQAFGYAVSHGLPVLYSVNEDGIDNGGRSGDWGEPGTDIIFFAPGLAPK